MVKMTPFRYVAIAGIPGSGKTTLARGLAEARGWVVLSTGDIARAVDPDGLAAGGLADESAFRRGWDAALASVKDTGTTVVFDGIPRSRGQLDLLPEGTKLLGLNVRPDIARQRLLLRGRPDDTDDIIGRRIEEQSALLEVRHADGWFYTVAGWGAVVDTSRKLPPAILAGVLGYLDGTRHEAF